MTIEIPEWPTADGASPAGSAALDAMITLTRLNDSLIQALHREEQARLEQELLSKDFRWSWSVRLGLYLRSWLCPDDSYRRDLYRFTRKAAFAFRRGPLLLVRKAWQKLRR